MERHGGKVVTPLEAVGVFSEVARHMLVADGAVDAGDRRLDGAESGVDPLEGRVAGRRPARAGDDRLVRAARLGDGGEAIQPVANHGAGRIERGLGKGLALDAPKPWTRRNLMPTGLPSTVVATAAMNGILPADPRPRWPPERLPPRSASSISMRPVSGFSAWRSSLTWSSLCFSVQAVVCLTPNRRANSRDAIPLWLWVRWYRAWTPRSALTCWRGRSSRPSVRPDGGNGNTDRAGGS